MAEWAEVIPSVRDDRVDQQDSAGQSSGGPGSPGHEDSLHLPGLEINEVLLV